MKRILIVSMTSSVHTARWVNQIDDREFQIVIYPSILDLGVHEKLNPELVKFPPTRIFQFLRKFKLEKYHGYVIWFLKRFRKSTFDHLLSSGLARLFHDFRPDVVHTLETQHAGYLFLETLNSYNLNVNSWWHTNWGSDFYLFARFHEHKEKIKKLLATCDYYSCESVRDVQIARDLGFEGDVMPVYPNTGGFNLDILSKIRADKEPTSDRKIIMVKGYQGWSGRGLVALYSLRRIKDFLNGYKIIIFSSWPGTGMDIAAKILALEAEVEVEFLPLNSSHDTVLEHFGSARIYLGLGISDGISTSLLEAMSMGAFPIQSDTSTGDEWIENGSTGFLVPPEDPTEIEKALLIALKDDDLVNRANELNYKQVLNRLDHRELEKITNDLYRNIGKQNNE